MDQTNLKNKSFIKTIAISAFALNIIVILVLLYFKSMVGNRLVTAHDLLVSLGNERIKYNVMVNDTLDINTSFAVTQSIIVFVEMQFEDTINILDLVPVNQTIGVPINFEVNQNLKVDTVILIKDKLIIPLDEKIPVHQMTIPGHSAPPLPEQTAPPLPVQSAPPYRFKRRHL